MNNLTKLLVGGATAIALVASSLTVVNAQDSGAELDPAVSFLFDQGMTRYNSTSTFSPNGTLTREQGSKFFSEFAVTNLCLAPDTSRSCNFSDLAASDYTLTDFITKSCQLGIFQGSNGQFAPTAPLTKAQFITALVRAVDGMKDETVSPRWRNYHSAAFAAGITEDADVFGLDRPVLRSEAAIMFYRARSTDSCDAAPMADAGNDDLGSILADLFGDDDTTTTTTTTTNPGTTTTTTSTSMCSDGTPLKTVGSSCDDGNANTSNDRYVDACNCGGDITTTVTAPSTSNNTTTTTTTNTSGAGSSTCNANVALNAASPASNGQEVPGLATAVLAMYDVTATSGDLLVDNLTLQRIGLGSDNAVNFVAMYTLDGSRVSNSQSFNNDEEAFISLNPKVTVAAGTTETFVVVAQVGSSALASNEEFAMRLVEFNSNCSVNVEGGTFEVAAVDAAEIKIEEDGNIDDVDLGEMGAEVATFTIDNEDDSDVFITALTLRDEQNNADDNLSNFVLSHNGNPLATTAMANGRYVTFQLATPFQIDDGDSEDFEVYADVIDGAGDMIEFIVERPLDVSGFDDTFGYGLFVDNSGYQSQPFEILAGDLIFVNHPIPTDQTRFDKDDVVLMEFHIDVNGGTNLILEDILFDLYSDSNTSGGLSNQCLPAGVDLADDIPGSNNRSLLENIQLKDLTNGGSYNLDARSTAGGNNCWVEISDTGLGLNLNAGQHNFQVIADVVDESDLSAADVLAIQNMNAGNGAEFYVELRPSSTDVEIEENANNVLVTDITPSFLASTAINIGVSGVELERQFCGTSEIAVNGAFDVELLTFEVDTDDVSPITFDEIQISADTGVCGAGFDDDHISVINLYRGVYPNGTLVDSETINGSNPVDFDGFGEILVPASSTQPMYVTVDLIDDDNNIGDCIAANVTNIDAEDDDNDDVPFVVFPTVCTPNQINIVGGGTLNITNSPNNNNIIGDSNVLCGETSDFVAAFDFNTSSEAMFIEDMTIVVGGAGAADFGTAVRNVTIFGSDLTTVVYGPVSVNDTTIDLNNINYTVPQNGGDTLYVKVEAESIGFNQDGRQSAPFNLSVVVDGSDAYGVDSGNNIMTLTSAPSDNFSVVPVQLSSIDFVSNAGTVSVDSTLSTDSNVAILKLVADQWSCTDSIGGDLDLKITSISLNETLGVTGPTTVTSYEIEKTTNQNDANPIYTAASVGGGGGLVTFNTSASTDDFVLNAGETAYYVVEAKGVALNGVNSGDDSVRLQIDDLSIGAITFEADDSAIPGFAPITDPNLGYTVVSNSAVVD